MAIMDEWMEVEVDGGGVVVTTDDNAITGTLSLGAFCFYYHSAESADCIIFTHYRNRV